MLSPLVEILSAVSLNAGSFHIALTALGLHNMFREQYWEYLYRYCRCHTIHVGGGMNRLHLHSHNFRRSGHVCRTSSRSSGPICEETTRKQKTCSCSLKINSGACCNHCARWCLDVHDAACQQSSESVARWKLSRSCRRQRPTSDTWHPPKRNGTLRWPSAQRASC